MIAFHLLMTGALRWAVRKLKEMPPEKRRLYGIAATLLLLIETVNHILLAVRNFGLIGRL
jgi:hypothetical protein